MSVLTSSNSYSGKSRLHMKYFKHPEKYFSYSSPGQPDITELIIITDGASVPCWRDNLDTPLPYKILDYDQAAAAENNGLELRSNSILLFDDLLLGNYKKLKSFVDKTLSVYCHHYNMTVFIINQSVLNSELSQLVLKVGEFQLCCTNNSANRTLNYIARYYFGPGERKLVMKALETGQRLGSDDTYMCLRLKNNRGVPVLLNRTASLEENPHHPCLAFSAYPRDAVSFRGRHYYIRAEHSGRDFIRLEKLSDLVTAMNSAAKEKVTDRRRRSVHFIS